jgi:transposase InsO family protein
MGRLYGVTRAGYYAWRRRADCPRRQRDRQLTQRIEAIYQASRGTYGSPRIHGALKAQGECVGRKRIERLMRGRGLKARAAKLYHANPGTHAFYASVPNRQLDRLADAPDRVWVGDITYLKVGGTWWYLAVVLDKFSRRVVGWSLGKKKDVRLTLSALNRAVGQRRPGVGLFFHTDRGIEYAAYAFRERLAELGFTQSMNRPGELTDNAHMESFFHSMKSDVIHGGVLDGEEQLARLLSAYIPYYNGVRLHSALDYRSPVVYEKEMG